MRRVVSRAGRRYNPPLERTAAAACFTYGRASQRAPPRPLNGIPLCCRGTPLQINRFHTPVAPRTVDELREHLRFRDDDGFACFWLWHDNWREMGVMFNRRQAYVHFFRGDGSAGAFALPAVEPENPDESVEFLADNGEPTPAQRWMVVDASVAEEAIIFFFESGERFGTVAWEEL